MGLLSAVSCSKLKIMACWFCLALEWLFMFYFSMQCCTLLPWELVPSKDTACLPRVLINGNGTYSQYIVNEYTGHLFFFLSQILQKYGTQISTNVLLFSSFLWLLFISNTLVTCGRTATMSFTFSDIWTLFELQLWGGRRWMRKTDMWETWPRELTLS